MAQDIPCKKCSKCGEVKPLTPKLWHRNKYSPDGFRPQCKICRHAEAVESYPKKKEHYRQYHQQYYAENKDRLLSSNKTWEQSNRAQRQKQQKRWAADNWAKNRAKQANHKARRFGVTEVLTEEDVLVTFEKWPYCLACGTDQNLTIDHVIPLSQKGSNTRENLQILCLTCNNVKHTKTIDYRKEVS